MKWKLKRLDITGDNITLDIPREAKIVGTRYLVGEIPEDDIITLLYLVPAKEKPLKVDSSTRGYLSSKEFTQKYFLELKKVRGALRACFPYKEEPRGSHWRITPDMIPALLQRIYQPTKLPKHYGLAWDNRETIATLRAQGKSFREIGSTLGISHETARCGYKRFEKECGYRRSEITTFEKEDQHVDG